MTGEGNVFEGFAGLRVVIEPKTAAGGGPWIRLRAHQQDVYLAPDTALGLAKALGTMATALGGPNEWEKLR